MWLCHGNLSDSSRAALWWLVVLGRVRAGWDQFRRGATRFLRKGRTLSLWDVQCHCYSATAIQPLMLICIANAPGELVNNLTCLGQPG